MDTKCVYEIIEDVDCCLLHVLEVRELVELFQIGFEAKDDKSGVIAAEMVLRLLQDIEKELNGVHGKLDRYGLLSGIELEG